MNIELKEITVRDLTNGYEDNQENGVIGYAGKLDIRPPYQREFIYKDKQRDAVINTVTKNFPLNVMCWAVREDGTFVLKIRHYAKPQNVTGKRRTTETTTNRRPKIGRQFRCNLTQTALDFADT